MNRETQLIAAHSAFNVGELPRHGDRAPVVKGRPTKARVLRAAFYISDAVPDVGDYISLPREEVLGLVQRKLVELVP